MGIKILNFQGGETRGCDLREISYPYVRKGDVRRICGTGVMEELGAE
jgi:hypothetical protein